jgi:hypothetical protein
VNAAAANVTAGDIAAAQGWYIPLASNEKVLTAANVFNKIVLFSTFTPTTTTTCDSGGRYHRRPSSSASCIGES